MAPTEAAGFSIMAAWLLGQLLYALPFPWLRPWLDRVNPGLWFANWSVFGAGGERAEIACYRLEYRDHRGKEDTEWVEALRGRPWRWHAFLWQPERRVADRLHRLAEGIARTADFRSDGARHALEHRCRMIANYVDGMRRRPPDTQREIRIVMKRAVIANRPGPNATRVEERVLLAFSADLDEC